MLTWCQARVYVQESNIRAIGCQHGIDRDRYISAVIYFVILVLIWWLVEPSSGRLWLIILSWIMKCPARRCCCRCSAPAKLKIHGEIVPGSSNMWPGGARHSEDWGSPTLIRSYFYHLHSADWIWFIMVVMLHRRIWSLIFLLLLGWYGQCPISQCVLHCLFGLDFDIWPLFSGFNHIFYLLSYFSPVTFTTEELMVGGKSQIVVAWSRQLAEQRSR